MGDASIKTEEYLLNNYILPNVDILKVGHHGSYTSTSTDFINVIKPKYSVISVGENNIYKHPNKSVLDILDNTKLFRTDVDGTIEVKISKKDIRLKLMFRKKGDIMNYYDEIKNILVDNAIGRKVREYKSNQKI